MRQKAVSSAPQKLAPTQTDATRAMMPAVVEDSRTWRSASLSVVSGGGGEELLEVGEDRALELRAGRAPGRRRTARSARPGRRSAGGCRRPSRRGRSGCPCRPSRQNRWSPDPIRRIGTAWRAGEPLSRRARWVPFGRHADPAIEGATEDPWPDSPSAACCWSASPSEQPPRTPSAIRSGSSSRVARPARPSPTRRRCPRRRTTTRRGRPRTPPRRCPLRLRWSRPSRGAASRSRSRRCRRTTRRP